MFKRYLLTPILAVAMLLLSPALSYASTLSLSPSTGTFNSNCAFSTDIILDTAGSDGVQVSTDGTDAILLYDASRLSVTSINKGSIYSDYPISSFDPQAGKITISGLAPSPGQSFKGKGTFATINFKVAQTAQTGPTTVAFDFDPNNPGKTTDSNVAQSGTLSDTLSGVVNGAYTIGSGTSCDNTVSGGKGGPISTSSATISGTLDKVVGGKGGFTQVTTLVALAGGFLTLLGIFGLALL